MKEIKDIISDLPKVAYYKTNEQTRGLLQMEPQFRDIIEARIHHCYSRLLENMDKAVVLYGGQTVCWEGGHFSVPVYKALIMSHEEKLLKWPAIIWQQIIRQMAQDKNTDMELINMATEMLLCSDKI